MVIKPGLWLSQAGPLHKEKNPEPLRPHQRERRAWHVISDQCSNCDSFTPVCSSVVSCPVNPSSSGLRHIFHGASKMLKIKPQEKFHVATRKGDHCVRCLALPRGELRPRPLPTAHPGQPGTPAGSLCLSGNKAQLQSSPGQLRCLSCQVRQKRCNSGDCDRGWRLASFL